MSNVGRIAVESVPDIEKSIFTGTETAASHITLANGLRLPRLGFGTWQMKGKACRDAVLSAVDAGYQLIDTGSAYRNEESVGEALQSSPGICIQSKCSAKEMGFDRARSAFEATVRRLGRSTIEVYLIHWPAVSKLALSSCEHRRVRFETWRALEELYFEGRVRAIGVSNFTARHLEELLEDGVRVAPMVNQIEVHPFFTDSDTLKFCSSHSIVVQAYSPLGGGLQSNTAQATDGQINGTQLLLANPEVQRVAREQGRSPAQVLLRWSLQKGFAIVARSTDTSRIAENAQIYDFLLSQQQIETLDALRFDDCAQKFCWDPKGVR